MANYDPLQNILRNVLESKNELKYGFRNRGLVDFFLTDGPSTNDPRWFAACTLEYFCYTDGAQNEFFISGIEAIVLFLRESNYTVGSIRRCILEIQQLSQVADPEDIFQVFLKYLVKY